LPGRADRHGLKRVILALLPMEITSLEDPRVFRYETQSGFGIETLDPVLPVFDPDEKSVHWYDFAPPSLTDTCSFPLLQQKLYTIRLTEDMNAAFGEVNSDGWCAEGSNTIDLDLTVPNLFDALTSVPVATLLEDQVQFSKQCLGRRENRIVDQRYGTSLLMAGREYLVPSYEREQTEAAAEDHVIHLQTLTRSREHSDRNLFSTTVQGLKKFGWRVWRNCSSSLNRVSGALARFSRYGQLCASFVVAFSIAS